MGKPGRHFRRLQAGPRPARRGFTLFGMLLAVSFCCLVMALFVTLRETDSPRHVLDHAEFSADGTKLAAFYFDGHVDVIDTASGVQLRTFQPEGAGADWQPFTPAAFSLDGRRVVVVGLDEATFGSVIQVWDDREDRVLQRHVVNGVVNSVALSPDGSQVAFVPPRGIGVSILDIETGAVTMHTPPNIAAWLEINHIRYSSDGRRLALAGRGIGANAAAVLDVASGTASILQSTPLGIPSAVAFTPDGQRLCIRTESATGAPAIHVFDEAGLARVRQFNTGANFSNNDELYFSPDSECVIVRDAGSNGFRPDDNLSNVIDLETLRPSDKWRVPENCHAVANSAPLAAAVTDRQVVFYNIETGEPTGVRINYGVGEYSMLIILALFFLWTIGLAMHRNRETPKILCPVCGRSMPGAKQAKDICQVCQASFQSVPESQRRNRKTWAIFLGVLLVLTAGGFVYSWKITLLFVAVLALTYGWLYFRLRQKQNLVKRLDTPPRPLADGSLQADSGMRHWSIDPAGAVSAVGRAKASTNPGWAREDEIVRRAVARARASFVRLLGREFDFSPGVNVTSFAEFDKLRDLLLKLGSGAGRHCSIYALNPMRRVLFCEAEAWNQLLDPETAICMALGYALFDTKAAKRAPAWLRSGVNHLVAFGADENESNRLNRGVRASLSGDSLIGPEMLRMPLKHLHPYWRQSNNFDAYKYTFQFGAFSSSLTEYLMTSAPADMQTGFVALFRAAQQGAAPANLIERHLHRSPEQLLADWRAWVESRACDPPAPTPEVEHAIVHELAPLVVNSQAVYLDRLRAIRTLGERGYLLGVDSLRTVEENMNDEPDLKRAAVFSLRMVESV